MNHTGTDKKNIGFFQKKLFPAAGNMIAVLGRHDQLKGKMSVGRVIFCFLILMKKYLPVFLVLDGFVDAFEMFDHGILPFANVFPYQMLLFYHKKRGKRKQELRIKAQELQREYPGNLVCL